MVRLYKFFPIGMQDWIEKQLHYISSKQTLEHFVNGAVTSSLTMGMLAGVLVYFLLKVKPTDALIVGVGGIIVLFLGQLFMLMNAADSRGRKVELILPDALQLIASNIKSGLTTERALLASALPEFGALSEALLDAGKELLAGERVEKALLAITTKIKSSVVERSIWMLVQGIKNGGQIANLLLQMSNDLREENALKAEVSANISMYVMLIFFSAALGAPALFGISSFIVGVLSAQAGAVHISPEMLAGYATKSPALGLIGLPSAAITEDFIVVFSVVALIITSFFASGVLGIINTGKEKGGIKYIPILLIVSILLFFIVRILIKGAFGGLT